MQDRKAIGILSMDWFTVIIYFLLIIIGWISIYSAGYNEDSASMFDLSQQYGKQLLWIGLSIILAIFTMSIDQRFFEAYAYVIYAVFILLLISVLFFGIEINGAKSWLDFGFIRLQPAEFAKIGTALALSAWISRYGFKMKKGRDFAIMIAIISIPMVLILLQNDLGSVLTYTSFIILFYRCGLNILYLITIFLCAALFITVLTFSTLQVYIGILLVMPILLFAYRMMRFLMIYLISAFIIGIIWWGGQLLNLWNIEPEVAIIICLAANSIYWIVKSIIIRNKKIRILGFFLGGALIFISLVNVLFGVFDSYQQDRILITLGLKSDPFGVEYHVIQSLIAIGSGGFSGKGFLQGTQTKFDFVPEQTTDFIFSTIGEEFGFVGTFIVIGLFLALLLRLLFLAERQRSVFSRNYGYTVLGIIFFHVLINIAMVIGIGPVIGVPLPFVSYGGSSLWGFTLLLFIFLKLDAKRKYSLMM